MTTKNLSTVVADVIQTYGITATNIINAYRLGGERFIGFVDNRLALAVSDVPSDFVKSVRSKLRVGHERVSSVSVKGLHLGTDSAQRAVGAAVDLVAKGVSLIATSAVRVERTANINALNTLNRVAMPAVDLVSQVAQKLEQGSSKLVRRVSGTAVPAKALATRKLNASTRDAAAVRKQVTRNVKKQVSDVEFAVQEQVDQVAATGKRITRKATTQVNQAVAASQKIKLSATRRVSKAVQEAATGTSNAARRVARKAQASAAAA
jgi:hypothetical protein